MTKKAPVLVTPGAAWHGAKPPEPRVRATAPDASPGPGTGTAYKSTYLFMNASRSQAYDLQVFCKDSCAIAKRYVDLYADSPRRVT